MEHIAGGALIIIGLLLGLFGGTYHGKDSSSGGARSTMPAWLDFIIKWSIGLVCIAFGLRLALGTIDI